MKHLKLWKSYNKKDVAQIFDSTLEDVIIDSNSVLGDNAFTTPEK